MEDQSGRRAPAGDRSQRSVVRSAEPSPRRSRGLSGRAPGPRRPIRSERYRAGAGRRRRRRALSPLAGSGASEVFDAAMTSVVHGVAIEFRKSPIAHPIAAAGAEFGITRYREIAKSGYRAG